MRIRVLTIFPELFAAFAETSLVGRAIERGLLELSVEDLRDYTDDPHASVDDEPYGGGGGMVMTAPPWIRAVRELGAGFWRVLLSPQGERLAEPKVRELAAREDLLLLCGRYEGIDERVRRTAVDEEVSIGDYVVSGGELPAMVVIEAVSRQIPGVVQLQDSVERDSFRSGLLDYPHYTRPRRVGGLDVPEVLLSGHHAAIEDWRRRQSLAATLVKRPDLLPAVDWTEAGLRELEEVAEELGASLPPGLQPER
jgi:tRNA (guanine37-N1)-methyltransferase